MRMAEINDKQANELIKKLIDNTISITEEKLLIEKYGHLYPLEGGGVNKDLFNDMIASHPDYGKPDKAGVKRIV